MPRSAGTLSFPDFKGFTRRLILWNLGVYFGLLVLGLLARPYAGRIAELLALSPGAVLHGFLWQLVTYSFVHTGLLGTALEMLSLWFLGSFLESDRGPRWMGELYFVSVVGAGLAAVGIEVFQRASAPAAVSSFALTGAFGGIFGLLIAFGVLYGDMQFMMFPLPISIKAKYLAAFYLLLATAEFFVSNRAFALAQLGGALAGYLFIKAAPRRGFAFGVGEGYFGLRNRYYKWKRRRAARKFQVYMRKQNRDVEFDREGRYVDPDEKRNPNDKRWMN